MQRDAAGLTLSTDDAAAARAFDHATTGYLKYRADTPQRLTALMAAAPDLAMAHVLKGGLMMLSFKAGTVPVAAAARAAAERLGQRATPRERAHIQALGAWVDGDLDRTLDIWEQILGETPTDVLAFRMHHFLAFWLGRPERMLAAAERSAQLWPADFAGYGSALACRAFAREELGFYADAERDGRAAIEIDRGDLWAAHAVAHVLEMQGRHDDGIGLLDALEAEWTGGNNLMHHLWWHRALYHFERGEFADVLALYDGRFRNLSSPLTVAQPDVYIDIQNATSMLFRLERQGVGVGARWDELADKAEARIGDCLSVFTLPHWMLALAAAGRFSAGERMLDALRAVAATGHGTIAPLVRDYALPIAAAVLARGQGEPGRACDLMRPALAGMARLGGSHAQQDVLEQVFLDCAVAARRTDDIALILARATTRFESPPDARRGYAEAARAFG